MLVGGILFEIVTGLMNIQYDYASGSASTPRTTIGAWVFIAGFVAHVVLKLPVVRRASVAVAAGRVAASPTPRPSRSTTAWSPPIPHRRR